MKYIILDLEATCDDKSQIQNEIIEIGAIKLNGHLEKIDEFQSFIRPIVNPILTPFCKNLTTIEQSDVDSAADFPEVLSKFQKWIGEDYVLGSWGFYDKNQFEKDCIFWKLDTKWLKNHISIKHQYQTIKGDKKGLGVGRALKVEGFKFDGTPHRGIDDARNISKIFVKYFNQLKWQQ